MKDLLTSSRAATLAALGLALVAGCAAVEPVPAGPDPHQTAMLSLMDECLAQQAQTSSRLESQNAQLLAQQTQLEALSAQITENAKLPAQSAQPSAPPPVCVAPPREPGKLVVGQLEKVWLPDIGIELTARVDTGAETSSLDARNIELFERNGSRWVRFEIIDPKNEEAIELERKLKRTVLIVQSNVAEPERRPVVRLSLTIGHVNQTAEFTLSDRSHLDYQLLVGRNVLQDVMIVDVSKKNAAPYTVDKNEKTDAQNKRSSQ